MKYWKNFVLFDSQCLRCKFNFGCGNTDILYFESQYWRLFYSWTLDALEKVDDMLKSSEPWKYILDDIDSEAKVTECGDAFLTLILTMTERYKILPQPGHK